MKSEIKDQLPCLNTITQAQTHIKAQINDVASDLISKKQRGWLIDVMQLRMLDKLSDFGAAIFYENGQLVVMDRRKNKPVNRDELALTPCSSDDEILNIDK